MALWHLIPELKIPIVQSQIRCREGSQYLPLQNKLPAMWRPFSCQLWFQGTTLRLFWRNFMFSTHVLVGFLLWRSKVGFGGIVAISRMRESYLIGYHSTERIQYYRNDDWQRCDRFNFQVHFLNVLQETHLSRNTQDWLFFQTLESLIELFCHLRE